MNVMMVYFVCGCVLFLYTNTSVCLQVFSSKVYFGFRAHRSKSMTLKMHLKEVSRSTLSHLLLIDFKLHFAHLKGHSLSHRQSANKEPACHM